MRDDVLDLEPGALGRAARLDLAHPDAPLPQRRMHAFLRSHSPRRELAGKARPEDRVVIVKTDKDTPYQKWIRVTSWIEQAGGTITLQLEEERTVVVP